MEMLTTTADRIRHARTAAGLTQQQIADYCGIERAAVSQWEARDSENRTTPSPENFAKIERLTGYPISWLVEGGPMPFHSFKSHLRMTATGSNVKMIREDDSQQRIYSNAANVRRVPLLTMLQVGSTGKEMEYNNEQETIGVDAELSETLGPNAFAVALPDNAMGPQYQQGDILIIDPDTAADPGDLVLAKLQRMRAAIFRKYRDRGTDDNGLPIFELTPLNDDYPIIIVNEKNPGAIIGPAVEYRRRLK